MAQHRKQEAVLGEEDHKAHELNLSALKEIISEYETEIRKNMFSIGLHHAVARQSAWDLFIDLKIAIADYNRAYIRNPDKHKECKEWFIDKAEEVIQKNMEVLQRDLGWGDYLKNLLKKLTNAVLAVPAALGINVEFFAVKRSFGEEKAKILQKGFQQELSPPAYSA